MTTTAGRLELETYDVIERLDQLDDTIELLRPILREALAQARAIDEGLRLATRRGLIGGDAA